MKKFKFISFLFIMIMSLGILCSCSGEQGPQGEQGEKGDTGAQGESGKDGTSLLTGEGEPSNDLGKLGDSYIDLESWNYYVKSNDGWTLEGNIKGESGENEDIDYVGTEGLIFYPINDNECAVSVGEALLLENIIIPSIYNGMKVTQIVYEGFSGCSNLISITLPSTIEKFDASAFIYCSNLKNVYYEGTIEQWCNIIGPDAECTPMYYADNFYMLDENKEWYNVKEISIPNTVDTINFGVFYGFENVEELTISSSVTTIGAYTFYGWESLENLYYNGTIEDWCNIEFEGSYYSAINPMQYAENIYFLDNNGSVEHDGNKYSLLTELVIPDSVTTIKAFAFYGARNLTSIIIPSSVTSIGYYAIDGGSATIYCEANNIPSGWNNNWNVNNNVYWGSDWEYDDNGNPKLLGVVAYYGTYQLSHIEAESISSGNLTTYQIGDNYFGTKLSEKTINATIRGSSKNHIQFDFGNYTSVGCDIIFDENGASAMLYSPVDLFNDGNTTSYLYLELTEIDGKPAFCLKASNGYYNFSYYVVKQ